MRSVLHLAARAQDQGPSPSPSTGLSPYRGIRGKADTRGLARHLRRNATGAERLLWASLRRRAVGARFRRQHVVGPYVLDFCAPSIGLAIEVDGEAHTALDAQGARRRRWDLARDVKLRRLRVVTLRFSNAEVLRHPDAVVASITLAIALRRGGAA